MTNLPLSLRESIASTGSASPGILEYSSSLLSAAMDATARAEEIARLASALDAAQAGLASVLEPVVEQHTENVWSGSAAARSRQALAYNNNILWRADRDTANLAADLRVLARQAAEEAERRWEEWWIAVYKGEVLTSFSFSG